MKRRGRYFVEEASHVLPPEAMNVATDRALAELSDDEREIIDRESRNIANKFHQVGVKSARILLARLGILFRDYPDDFDRLKGR